MTNQPLHELLAWLRTAVAGIEAGHQPPRIFGVEAQRWADALAEVVEPTDDEPDTERVATLLLFRVLEGTPTNGQIRRANEFLSAYRTNVLARPEPAVHIFDMRPGANDHLPVLDLGPEHQAQVDAVRKLTDQVQDAVFAAATEPPSAEPSPVNHEWLKVAIEAAAAFRAEAAAARADSERLDWLEQRLEAMHCNFVVGDTWSITAYDSNGSAPTLHGQTVRDAIDKAMQADRAARTASRQEGE